MQITDRGEEKKRFYTKIKKQNKKKNESNAQSHMDELILLMSYVTIMRNGKRQHSDNGDCNGNEFLT